MKPKDRINHLKGLVLEAQKEYDDNGDTKEYRSKVHRIYSLLRASWERTVEDVLLDGIVKRFRSSVETRRLARVTVEDPDFDLVQREITKCSKMTDAHDPASTSRSASRLPTAVIQDIETLNVFVDVINKRKDGVEKRRKILTHPPPPRV